MAAFQQQLAAEPPSLVIIRRELDRVLREQPFPAERSADVRLAVSEACANAVIHAYPGEDPGALQVSADVRPDALVVTVRDFGCGLPVRPSTEGLGVTLIRELADAVECSDANPGVAVRLEFQI